MIRRSAAVAVALVVLAAPIAGAAPAPKTNLADVEDEVMCTVCGTLLELSDSPQAQQEKDFIRQRIAQGQTKAQIKQEMVRQFGPRVLALPPASGFDLSAYVVPAAALALAVLGVAIGLRRWRRAGGRDAPPPALASEESKRLDDDLARYDL